MKILAFETSCDDTAVAIVEDGVNVLASVRNTQPDHSQWGGVVPEIAARLHSENWRKTLEQCLDSASLTIEDIDAIAVTQGPGLQTSLLTGTTAASFLGLLFHKPIIPVQHIFGHITSTVLGRNVSDIQFPSITLTVSGGHTSMFLYKSFTEVENLGNTLDDAAGEAFDKVAKMLGLGYPGGPIVSKLAEKGDRAAYKFPRIFLGKTSLDFSFSGLKAAVYRVIEDEKINIGSDDFSDKFIENVCASFEEAVADIFLKKLQRVLEFHPDIKQIHFVGGVSANTYIREKIRGFFKPHGIELLVPTDFSYCTDNAAMIGSAAYFLAQKSPCIAEAQYIDAKARLPLH